MGLGTEVGDGLDDGFGAAGVVEGLGAGLGDAVAGGTREGAVVAVDDGETDGDTAGVITGPGGSLAAARLTLWPPPKLPLVTRTIDPATISNSAAMRAVGAHARGRLGWLMACSRALENGGVSTSPA